MNEKRRRGEGFGVKISASRLLFFSFILSCGKSAPSAAGPAASVSAPSIMAATSGDAGLEGPLAELWARAKEGEAEDLARLADREGSAGLIERASMDPSLRLTAIRALAYGTDLSALGWLADVGAQQDDAAALAALDSAVELASRERHPVDPEDGSEVRDGCDRLLAIAKDTARAKARRVLAIRAMRMLADRGCAKEKDIPSELDAK